MRAIEELIIKTQEAQRKKYPNVPQRAMATPTYSDATANGLTKAVLAWLKLNGHMAYRQSSEGRYRPGEKVTDVLGHVRQMKGLWLPSNNVGAADVCAIIQGQFLAIEIKIGRDIQSEGQKRYQREVESSGGLYFLVHSFDQFMKEYRNLINPEENTRI